MLNEILKKCLNEIAFESDPQVLKKEIRQACIEYARSVVPEDWEVFTASDASLSEARDQILSHIQQDEDLTKTF